MPDNAQADDDFDDLADDGPVNPPPAPRREAMDRLNANNRILTEARMLPQKAKLTDEHISSVVAAFTKFLTLHNIKLAQAAVGCGYNSTTLSEWRSGKYKGDRTAVTYAVNNWIELEARRISADRPNGFISTVIAEDIRSYAYLADSKHCMAAIVAPSGTGKTKVLQVLKEEMNAVMVTCRDKTSSMSLLRMITHELDPRHHWTTSKRDVLYAKIIDDLSKSKRPVFIDEAHRVGRDIGCLRSISDEAQVAVVMVGTDEILGFVDDRFHGRGQMARRCLRYNGLDEIRDVGGPDGGRQGRDLFSLEEIREFFDMKKIRLADDEALMALWALACIPGYGSLGTALMVAQIASDYADENGITTGLIRDALGLHFGRNESRAVTALIQRQSAYVPKSQPRMVAAG